MCLLGSPLVVMFIAVLYSIIKYIKIEREQHIANFIIFYFFIHTLYTVFITEKIFLRAQSNKCFHRKLVVYTSMPKTPTLNSGSVSQQNVYNRL